MAKYSSSERLLHRLYLGNYTVANAALEMEILINGKKGENQENKEIVFVTGLARSGTTGVMRKIFETNHYASLQYSNMPFVLNPTLWKKESSIESHERTHNDGIVVDGNSPEEFDEFFWKSQLKDNYISETTLELHEPSSNILELYKKYIRLICLAKGKDRYLSKNNNTILRLASLRKLENSKFIILFRHPISHAASLLKLHKKFSEEQRADPFILEYFNYLGHHEFGLNHKPFALTDKLNRAREYNTGEINYWICIWLNYYEYVLANYKESDVIVCFEDLIENPDRVYSALSMKLDNHTLFEPSKGFSPTTKTLPECDGDLKEKSIELYDKLLALKL